MAQVSYGQMTIADLTDNYQVQLSPESASFAGGTSSAKDGNITVIVSTLQGNKRIAHTIGNPTGLPSGMTVTNKVNGTANADGSFKVNVTTTLTSTSGYFTIPITVGGVVYSRRFSYSVGREGASVTITDKSVTYQVGSSGTSAPTGTWQNTVQTPAENQYLWTKTEVTYSDGNKTVAYSVSRNAKNGVSPTATKTQTEYQQSTNGTTPPTGTWLTSAPDAIAGQYMWTRTTVTYSDSATSISYSVSRNGADGDRGTGFYSVTTAPSAYTTTVSGFTPSYRIALSTVKSQAGVSEVLVGDVIQQGYNTYPVGYVDSNYVYLGEANSIRGQAGAPGIHSAQVVLYKRGTTAPTDKPSGDVTYTFATGKATNNLGSWSQTIPSGTDPVYMIAASASSTAATDKIPSSEWSAPVKILEDGTDGYNQATIFLYQRAASPPGKPTATPTYTFSTGALSANPSGWLRTIPANDGNPCYVTTAVAISKTDTVTVSGWSDVSKLAEDGKDGNSPTAYSLVVSHAAIEKNKAGTYNPTSITVTAKSQTGTAAPVNWANGYIKIESTTNNTSWTNVYSAKATTRTQTIPTTTGLVALRCSLYYDSGYSNLLYQQTIPIVSDGTDGAPAYTVVLSNESHTFSAGTSAVTTQQTATCKVIAYKGASQTTCYVGSSASATSITTGVSGLTCAISNNNSQNVTLTFTATTALSTKNGTVSIPVVVDGKSFTKIFTFSLALTGTSVTGVSTSKSGDETTITISMSDGTSKQFTVKDGAQGDTGATAQWYYGTDLSHTSGKKSISADLTPNAVVGSMYLNPDTSLVYRCTAVGTSNEWTYAGDLTTGVINNIEIGGRNLIRNGDFSNLTAYWTKEGSTSYSVVTDSRFGHALSIVFSAAGSASNRVYQNIADKPITHVNGESRAIRFWAKASTATTITVGRSGTAQLYLSAKPVSTAWQKYEANIVANGTGSLTFFAGTACTLYLANIMLVSGNVPMDWTPAPEDTEAAITALDESFDQEKVFNRLTNNGQAQGLMFDNTTGDLYINAEYINTGVFKVADPTDPDNPLFYANMDTHEVQFKPFDKLGVYVKYDDDGLILGREEPTEDGKEPLTLRLTNSEIAFYQASNKVAYINDNQLYIQRARFLNSINIANFSYIPQDDGGLAFMKTTNLE